MAAAARGFFLWPNSGCNTMRYGSDPESCRGGCLKRAAALGFVFNWQKCDGHAARRALSRHRWCHLTHECIRFHHNARFAECNP